MLKLAKYLTLLLIALKQYRLLAWIYARQIRALPDVEEGRQKTNVLVLNTPRFRGEPETLNGARIRIFMLPFEWQTRLLALYFPKDRLIESYDDFYEFYEDNPDLEIYQARQKLRAFLKPFLKELYDILDIKAVISASVHYHQDIDWGAVSSRELGVPYIVLHRENTFVAAEGNRRETKDILKNVAAFTGDQIIVFNEMARQSFLETGIVDDEKKISALGCLRMDGIMDAHVKAEAQDIISLFSFAPGGGLPHIIGLFPDDESLGYQKLFRKTHAVFIRLAAAHPDIRFVIKSKFMGIFYERMKEIGREQGVDIESLNNLTITNEGDAQEIIAKSRVVAGFGSTTLMEAALMGKAIVVPDFEEAHDEEYKDFVRFREIYDLFIIADTPEKFAEEIMKAYDNPGVDEALQEKRRVEFERYISPVEGVREAYINKIEETVRAARA